MYFIYKTTTISQYFYRKLRGVFGETLPALSQSWTEYCEGEVAVLMVQRRPLMQRQAIAAWSLTLVPAATVL